MSNSRTNNKTMTSLSTLKNMNYYQRLDVPYDATTTDINTKFKQMALLYHPDKFDSPDATISMQLIMEAKETLTDPDKRLKYDLQIDLKEIARDKEQIKRVPTWRGLTEKELNDIELYEQSDKFAQFFPGLNFLFGVRNKFPKTGRILTQYLFSNPELFKKTSKDLFDLMEIVNQYPEMTDQVGKLVLEDPVLCVKIFTSMDDFRRAAKFLPIPDHVLDQPNINAVFEVLFEGEKRKSYYAAKNQQEDRHCQQWLRSISSDDDNFMNHKNNTQPHTAPPEFLFICFNSYSLANTGIQFYSGFSVTDKIKEKLLERVTASVSRDFKEIRAIRQFKEAIFATEQQAREFKPALIVKVAYKDPSKLSENPFTPDDLLQYGTAKMMVNLNDVPTRLSRP